MQRSVRLTLAASAVALGAILIAVVAGPAGPSSWRGGPDRPGSGDGPVGPGAAVPPGLVRVVANDLRHDTSPTLRSLPPGPATQGREGREEEEDEEETLPGRTGNTAQGGRDPVAQTAVVGTAPSLDTSWEGVDNRNGVLPPDTNGDIGPDHYVQWVNLSFAIYSRTGTLLYGPANGNTLWTGFGGPCEGRNDGDPIVQYDHLADRWMMSQFALPNYPSGPFYQCIAVSQTPDPTGAWHRYEFKISDTKLNDYPHFGVWPDGYYMSVNQFSGGSWAGAGAVAFERTKMLAGQAAQMVYFDLYGVDPNLGGMLPSDLDGPAPAAGAPNVFAQADDDGNGYPNDRLELWAFHVDWTDTASSTFTGPTLLATAPFDSNLCGYARTCIPQPDNPPRSLDAISDRLMYRVQYRHFADHDSLVLVQTVDVTGTDQAGIRWWELRKPASTWSIHQQGTWAPDATNRWNGSIAMDGLGNIALGYSVSSSSVYPGIRFTGRLAGDTLGQMTQGEGTIIEGTGRQTHTAARWGDYSMLAVDPTDDCTFWYTNEYVQTSGLASWQTRIASFRLPGCGGGDLTPPSVTAFTAPATPTNSATLTYALTFSESVTGLAAGDFTKAGTATGCTVGTPTGSGASWSVGVTGCSDGTLTLTLLAASVADTATNPGPAANVAAATVRVDRTAPASAASIAAATTTGTSVAVDYTASDAGAGVASVTAYRSTSASLTSPTACGSASSSAASGTITCTIPAVDATYYVYTRAADAAGNVEAAPGAADDSIVRSTATAPGAPTAVVATAANASAAVTWSAPASNGGAAITGYTVTSAPGGKTCTTGGTIGCTVTGLTNLVTYTFTVTATNGVGTGPASAASDAVVPFGPGTVLRYGGPDRFATAAAISAATFKPGVAVAYIAYAYDFPDALAGAAAAGTVKGPVLYAATTGALNPSTAAELTRVAPQKIVILGSTGVISDGVATQLAAYTSGPVVRYAGADRFATAAAVSAATFSPGVDVAYVAYAYNFPDALAGAAAAGTIKGPVLYAATTGALNPATATELTRLAPKRIVVLGGTSVISDTVKGALQAYTAGSVTRLSGASRFGTAAAISAATFSPRVGVAYIAYAYGFADALAGAAAAGTVPGPILYADTSGTLNADTAAELARLQPKLIIVLGSTGVISDGVATQLAPYATGP